MTFPAASRKLGKAEAQAPKRRTVRIILPSNRVAEFTFPTVGEFLQIRRDALSKVVSDSPEKPTELAVSIAGSALLLRRHLTGITLTPVISVPKVGFDVAKARADAIDAGLDPDVAEDACEDVEKTKAAAVIAAITDQDWDLGVSAVGKVLAAMPGAELGTPEAADWEALDTWINTRAMPTFKTPPEIEGFPKARMRGLRG
jgi:hypothetical protein